jgi:hypothetical protein
VLRLDKCGGMLMRPHMSDYYRRLLDESERAREPREREAHEALTIVANGGVPVCRADMNDLTQAGVFGPVDTPRCYSEPRTGTTTSAGTKLLRRAPYRRSQESGIRTLARHYEYLSEHREDRFGTLLRSS